MLIRKLRPKRGIKFAWKPVWTDEGQVWFEWVHYEWTDGGLDGGYIYRRWIPEKEYDAGKRAQGQMPSEYLRNNRCRNGHDLPDGTSWCFKCPQ